MNVLAAVYQVLSEAGQPLHYREITDRILAQKLWHATGKTPWATVNAQLATDVKNKGASSRFQRVGRGVFALSPDSPEVSKAAEDSAITAGTPQGPISFGKAAEEVLDRYANRQPMHYREITQKALDLGLISTAGQTPEATMYAQVLTEIQRATRRGQLPRFTKHGKGLFGLTKWLGKGLAFEIEQHNREVAKKLRQRILKMEPAEFEALIGRLLTALGFESVSVTPRSSDGGIDVRGTLVVGDVIRTRMAVQVKRWKQNVQAPVVQQVRGSLGAHEQGLVITTSDFSQGAREEAEQTDKTPIGLMNGDQLVALLIENQIGVHRTSHDLVELDEEEQE
jgi:restriction system protein